MHKKIKEEINAVLFFTFFFLQNITQSIVPNIKKISYTTKGFRANCSDCEIQIYEVYAECPRLNNIPDFEATHVPYKNGDVNEMEIIQ